MSKFDQAAVEWSSEFDKLEKSDPEKARGAMATARGVFGSVLASTDIGLIQERVLAGALWQITWQSCEKVRNMTADETRKEYKAKLDGLKLAIARTIERFE